MVNVELLNEAEIDYATIGNNEGVTFSKQQLEQLYAHAQFPVLLANLFEPNGQLPSWARKYRHGRFVWKLGRTWCATRRSRKLCCASYNSKLNQIIEYRFISFFHLLTLQI